MSSHLKKLIKSSIAAVGYSTGMLQRQLDSRLSGKAAVLMYHRVLPPPLAARTFSTDGIVVTTKTFRMQMRIVRQHLCPLDIEGFMDCMRNGNFPERACLVTFDDGWFDNHEFALPILSEMKVPAVVFLATSYVGTSTCFWQERLAGMLCFGMRPESGIRPAVEALLDRWSCPYGTGSIDRRAARVIVDQIKRRSPDDIRKVVAEIEDISLKAGYVCDSEIDRFMSWSQARDLATHGTVTVGSHCISHTPLTRLGKAEATFELERSREIIGTNAGAPPDTLAYPNGDCSDEIARSARSAGYALAFTTQRGHVTPGTNPHLLPRINVHEYSTDSPGLFLARVGLMH